MHCKSKFPNLEFNLNIKLVIKEDSSKHTKKKMKTNKKIPPTPLPQQPLKFIRSSYSYKKCLLILTHVELEEKLLVLTPSIISSL